MISAHMHRANFIQPECIDIVMRKSQKLVLDTQTEITKSSIEKNDLVN
jgi:hypothetical protein